MVCRDSWDDDGLAEQKARLDKITRLLYALCRHIEDYEGTGIYISSIPGLKTWWEEHKKADVAREADEAEKRRQEEVKRNALNKLIEEEKQLLRVRE